MRSRKLKRLFDLIFAGTGFLVCVPVLLVVAICILISMGFPVLFRQRRPGKNGVPFTLFKFRTMSEEKDAQGHPISDAKRLSPVGYFLRKASLDELPQLINVIKGEMSIVGPRPLLMAYLSRYSAEQARRHEVVPGITGWAQVNGRNSLSWDEKFKLDVWYVDNWSLWLDLKIIFLSVKRVISQKDVNKDGHATAEEFLGATQSKPLNSI